MKATTLWRLFLLCFVLVALPVQAQTTGDDPAAPATEQADQTETPAVPPVAAEEAEEAEEEEQLSPRGRYNRGLDILAEADWDQATEAFLLARDEAATDAELRYRSAFNLGLVHAHRADEQEEEKPEEAIELLRKSAAWFNDAVRQAPEGDDDARVNLEIVLRRIQQLADQLNQGKQLEARLDRVIDDQRGLRDKIRQLLTAIELQGAGAEPLGFQREFDGLATFERTLLAEVGSISDLAAEEQGGIENKLEEERSEEDSVRLIQLQNLDHYVQLSRQSLSDTRRRLRRLEGERAHRRADTALAELKRAREQLHDPITVLKAIVQDETELLTHTRQMDLLRTGSLTLEDDQPAGPPPWLNEVHLTERQEVIAQRSGEVLARLNAGVAAADAPDAEPPAEPDPQQQRMIQNAREAIPFLEDAGAAMDGVVTALPDGRLDEAAQGEIDSIRALLRAIERFAGLRELIELAYGEQGRAVALLTPPQSAESPVAQLSPQKRTELVRESADSNEDRLERLEDLLQEERQKAEAEASQQGEPDPEQLEAIGQRFDLAEQLRGETLQTLDALDKDLRAVESGQSANPLANARKGHGQLEELRRLFFNLIEHLKELLRNQAETHDRTATVQFEGVKDPGEVVPVSDRQQEHATIGDALAGAIEEQTDAAATSEDPQAQQAVENLTKASEEMRSATSQMHAAKDLLADAVAEAEMASPDLEPSLAHQVEAMQHLEEVIRLLQPPQEDQNQDQQQQQQQQQEQAQEPMSQRQAQRRLQAIRDREAERQRRREREPTKPEPVEKDW